MFALRFTGYEAEIDPLTPCNGQPASRAWRWERLDPRRPRALFRREVYRAVA